MSNEEGWGKTYLHSSCCFPITERSHEKGAYLDEIKSKMRGSGLGLGKRDDSRPEKAERKGGVRTARPGVGVWAGWIWGEY